jgi:hypothetical protein
MSPIFNANEKILELLIGDVVTGKLDLSGTATPRSVEPEDLGTTARTRSLRRVGVANQADDAMPGE